MNNDNFVKAIAFKLIFISGIVLGLILSNIIWEKRCIKAKVGLYDSKTGDFKFIEVK